MLGLPGGRSPHPTKRQAPGTNGANAATGGSMAISLKPDLIQKLLARYECTNL
jgi:hypothetical protein